MSTYVAVFALVLAYVAFVAAYLALRTLAKLRKATTLLSKGTMTGAGKTSLIEATKHHAELTAQVASDLEALREYVDQTAAETRTHADEVRATLLDEATRTQADLLDRTEKVRAAALEDIARTTAETEGAMRHTALIRYDAFAGMSGRLSFSLALLDDTGTGVTISALAGPDDTRVYAKGVAGGRGEHDLSPEESQAVASALGRKRPVDRRAVEHRGEPNPDAATDEAAAARKAG